MSKKRKAAIIIAMLTAIILSFVGGQTFSKYVTEVNAIGTAEVATWSFKVNGSTRQAQTINLASTCNNASLVNNKIAPGTNRKF